MKTPSLRFLYNLSLLIVPCLVLTCISKKSDQTTLRVINNKKDSLSLAISSFHIFKSKDLGSFKINSNTDSTLTINIQKPLIASTIINNKKYKLYVEPQYNMTLKIDKENDFPTFEGDGEAINNYLIQINGKVSTEVNNGLWDLELDSFVKKIDSLEIVLNIFTESYLKKIKPTNKFASLISSINRLSIPYLKEKYLFYFYTAAIVDQYYSLKENIASENFEKPAKLMVNFNEIFSDTLLFSLGDGDYKSLIYFYEHTEIYYPKLNPKTLDRIQPGISLAVANEIASKSLPLTEYMLGKNLEICITERGRTPASEIDSLFSQIENLFPNSNYINDLHKERALHSIVSVENEEKAIAPASDSEEILKLQNQRAIDFIGQTRDGKKIALSDYYGRVIFIDVWASWCGPCREETPYLKELISDLSKTNTVFLIVSIDKKPEAWKKLVDRHPDLKGEHILIAGQELVNFLDSYLIETIPRYMIINEAGIIAEINAARPSSGNSKTQILKVLNK